MFRKGYGSIEEEGTVSDVVVTVPMGLWYDWLEEGDLAGEEEEEPLYNSHFWIPSWSRPMISLGERVYIVAHGKLRGYAPLTNIELRCVLRPERACLVRCGGAVAVTIPEPVRGFQGWRYRWWKREDEVPFPEWMVP